MSALDVRTRVKADIRPVDVLRFFEDELPALIAERGALALAGAAELCVRPTAFLTQSGGWTVSLAGGAFVVSAGDLGESAIRMSDAQFGAMINDLITPVGLLSADTLELERGTLDDICGWWAVFRSLLDGRRVHTAGAIGFHDRKGDALDLDRVFTPDDDDADIAHFLKQAGFLHLSGWLDQDQMARIANDIDREFSKRTKGDGSWWTKLEDGSERPVRMPGFATFSAAVREVIASERYLRIGRLTGDSFEPSLDVEALVKPIGVVEGISNLPWHNDCSQGMHSYKCCNLVVGISVTGADASSGQLHVVPGSHRALMPTNRLYAQSGLEPRPLPTKTGDMTVHCSCTMHMSQAPTRDERKVLYTGFALAPLAGAADDEAAALRALRDNTHRKVSTTHLKQQYNI